MIDQQLKPRDRIICQLASGRVVGAVVVEVPTADFPLVSFVGMPAQQARPLTYDEVQKIEACSRQNGDKK